MYQISCVVPAGASAVDVAFEYVAGTGGRGPSCRRWRRRICGSSSGTTCCCTPRAWIRARTGSRSSVRLPAGWTFATALKVADKTADGARFAPITLETLVDSPVATGAYGRTLDLSPSGGPPHELCLFADSREALAITDHALAGLRQLVLESRALFGGWPYARYRFLLSLSNHVPHGGLEHHESSDNRVPERTLIDDAAWMVRAGLLPHEQVHAWNGKLRRPRGLATRDYQQPMKTDLLWVYEGLDHLSGRDPDRARRPAHPPRGARSAGLHRRLSGRAAGAQVAAAGRHRGRRADAQRGGAGVARAAPRPGLLPRGAADLAGGRRPDSPGHAGGALAGRFLPAVPRPPRQGHARGGALRARRSGDHA